MPVEVRHLVSQIPSAGPVVTGAEQWFAHAALDALEPAPRYHYRFRLPDGTVTPDAVFTTAPAPRQPRAVHLHRPGRPRDRRPRPPLGARRPQRLRRRRHPPQRPCRRPRWSTGSPTRRPAFHLLAGDICYADAQGLGAPETFSTQLAQTNDYDPFAWSAYFAMIERSAATTPWMFTTGNHDMEALYGTPQNVPPRADLSHGYGGHLQRLALPDQRTHRLPVGLHASSTATWRS